MTKAPREPRAGSAARPEGPTAPASVAPDLAPGPRPAAPATRPGLTHGQAPVLAVVAAGGALGAAARYGAALLWPTAAGGFPWTTLLVNAVGCAVIGVFMVVVTDVWAAHRLVRPFFGTGVLGGFTTFSTYAVDIQHLLRSGEAGTGLAYLAVTVVAALAAVWCSASLTRRLVCGRRK
ncbi:MULTISPECIES: fluoride efflux transporter CrcB [Streptomyces]|uniref:fluoride efflux transporter CrcB n=1 Tax=Streptomyces TaxID=1883 RepID=UPI001B39C00A|nr:MULTISPECIES: fluoride efflux transporter CrcB [Streptomyces]MBQ0883168.1 fluoride efflux transporter CrcB [Streptomyces sp. RT42]MDI3102403.1 fluoride efflux transporter CrcB [Streptomyces sp. AN-3]WDI19860.1 fluoride efflux transporter CrcB [Streptomyces enissocaesilis]WQC14309.1 fluoride efflux transporter CrcB [Streptomyces rochei]